MPVPLRVASCFSVSVAVDVRAAEPFTNVTLTVLAALGAGRCRRGCRGNGRGRGGGGGAAGAATAWRGRQRRRPGGSDRRWRGGAGARQPRRWRRGSGQRRWRRRRDRRAAEPSRLAGQAARSAPCLAAPWRAPALRRQPWPVDWARPRRGGASAAAIVALACPRSPAAVAAAAAARCPGRTGPATHSAAKDRRSAPRRPRAARWCGRRSVRWQCWRARRGQVPRASAARRPNSDKAGRRQVAAAALPRSCRLAGRATNSPGSSMRGSTSIRPAAAPTTARGGQRRPEVPDSGPQSA